MVIVECAGIPIGGGHPLVLIAGPCVIESEEFTLRMARRLRETAAAAGVPLIFKASYDKANRTSWRSFRGPGLLEGLRVLQRVKTEVGLPVLSDVHRHEEIAPAAEVLDALQVPAFLCRQTDFVQAVAKTGKVINVKKGQFLSPWEMTHVVEKIRAVGNDRILLTERGASFGYGNLVADLRALPILRQLGYPVVFDGTHSVQLPGAADGRSGGQREFVPVLCRAAVAAGCDALFLEVHEQPDAAMSDGPNMVPLDELPDLLRQVAALHALARTMGV
jgi:2-dehydro-3-deoxyphosphooctonate aldolase (KDO 8-P synthase)